MYKFLDRLDQTNGETISKWIIVAIIIGLGIGLLIQVILHPTEFVL